jgi:hypothetical protein
MNKNENDGIDPFKVFVRVRPLLEREIYTGEGENKMKVKPTVFAEENAVNMNN